MLCQYTASWIEQCVLVTIRFIVWWDLSIIPFPDGAWAHWKCRRTPYTFANCANLSLQNKASLSVSSSLGSSQLFWDLTGHTNLLQMLFDAGSRTHALIYKDVINRRRGGSINDLILLHDSIDNRPHYQGCNIKPKSQVDETILLLLDLYHLATGTSWCVLSDMPGAQHFLDLAVTTPLTLHWPYMHPHAHWAYGSPWWAKPSVCFLVKQPWEGSDPLRVWAHLQNMEAASHYLCTPVTLNHTPSESVQEQRYLNILFFMWLVADHRPIFRMWSICNWSCCTLRFWKCHVAVDSHTPCNWVHHTHSTWSVYQFPTVFNVAAMQLLLPVPHCQWNSSVLPVFMSTLVVDLNFPSGETLVWAIQHSQATQQQMGIVGLLLTYLQTEPQICTIQLKKTLTISPGHKWCAANCFQAVKGSRVNAIYRFFFHVTEIYFLSLT